MHVFMMTSNLFSTKTTKIKWNSTLFTLTWISLQRNSQIIEILSFYKLQKKKCCGNYFLTWWPISRKLTIGRPLTYWEIATINLLQFTYFMISMPIFQQAKLYHSCWIMKSQWRTNRTIKYMHRDKHTKTHIHTHLLSKHFNHIFTLQNHPKLCYCSNLLTFNPIKTTQPTNP